MEMEHYKADSLPKRESRKDNHYTLHLRLPNVVYIHTHTLAGIDRVFCPRYRGSVELLTNRMSHTGSTFKSLPKLKNKKAHGVVTVKVDSRQCI